MNAKHDAAAARLQALLELMARLRDPQQGCPWDRAQDFSSIVPHTLEEAYELADAIAGAEPSRIRDELGDLLFQVIFYAQLGAERGWFGFAEVAAGLEDKLRRRHPHVFGDAAARTQDAGAVSLNWEAHKADERRAAGQSGALDGVPLALPALSRAAKISRRAARLGFDWRHEAEVRAKIAEELRETEQAIAAGDRAAVAEELGDVLFAVVNWARLLELDPEAVLRAANLKFERRFRGMEHLIAERGLAAGQLDADAWEALWQEAKRQGG
jgi:ATP diphosphatase